MKMNKAFKFRLYPDIEQQEMFAKTFGCCRFIYNKMLENKIAHYEKTKEMLYATPAKYKPQYPWLREVDSLALCNEQLHLETAYKNFFSGESGFPCFKRKHDDRKSYTTNLVNGNIELEVGFLKLPKVGRVKIRQHRSIPEGYKLKSVTISLTPTGKYYAAFLYEYEADIEPVIPSAENVVGLDFSMNGFYVSSDGVAADHPHPYRKAQSKLAREQRKLSKHKKGGKNYAKQKKKIARVCEKVKDQRMDYLHKASREIANACDVVCIESLDMKGMSKALNFGKSVNDNGWGMFTRMLGYKLEDQGKRLVVIDKWFPSSKTCSCCGGVKSDLSLSERIYHCERCGYTVDRDLNAARNIKNEGIRILDASYLNRGAHGDSLLNKGELWSVVFATDETVPYSQERSCLEALSSANGQEALASRPLA